MDGYRQVAISRIRGRLVTKYGKSTRLRIRNHGFGVSLVDGAESPEGRKIR
jgi:hypothetical protein